MRLFKEKETTATNRKEGGEDKQELEQRGPEKEERERKKVGKVFVNNSSLKYEGSYFNMFYSVRLLPRPKEYFVVFLQIIFVRKV